jgi:hypothetical protein
VLSGIAVLAVAAVGATFSVPSDTAETAFVAIAGHGVTSTIASTADEFADLRTERDRALVQAARSAERATVAVAPATAAPAVATTPAYVTVAVNVRVAAVRGAEVIAVLEPGTEIAVTGRVEADYVEVLHAGQHAWVFAGYVSATPVATEEVGGAVSGAPCPDGSGVESGLTANAIAVHRAVCALFPGVSSYGGWRADGGEHGSGRALDIMVSTDLGNAIASWLQAHAAELGVSELLWRQRIWTTERAGDGWRWMSDRGSATANHYDHVHVTVH